MSDPKRCWNRLLIFGRPETMGAVCAVVYLLLMIAFIPFPFYKDIVAATSGGGNRDVVLHIEHVETGRFLHRFPHNKVCSYSLFNFNSIDADDHSWHPTSPAFCPSKPSPSSASEMTSSTSAGATKS